MKIRFYLIMAMMILGFFWGRDLHAAFSSGSTGADGPLAPAVNTTLQLPVNGVFNFTTVNIPTGVTVKFLRNSANTPVTILTTGDMTVAGTIDISGGSAAASGTAGDGNLGDDGQPGVGGPGGFNGGFGGPAGTLGANGGPGQGPGGGNAGIGALSNTSPRTGSAGGFALAGGTGGDGGTSGAAAAGVAYGTATLVPLIGGSGGGGGAAGINFGGGGGGGGGGAILIASSGTLSVTGSILANGGAGGSTGGTNGGSCGGGGSGGGIRLVANTLSGNGSVSANGGNGCSTTTVFLSGAGSVGRIRLEGQTITRTAATTPSYTVGTPGTLFVPGNPTLRITSVAGVAAPDNPTGSSDITLPSSTANPVAVTLSASGIPIGTAIAVSILPTTGAKTSVNSTALSGTIDAATASASVTLPSGPSVLSASATFTLTQTSANDFPVFADGERIEKVRVAASLGGKSSVVYITASGREVPAESFR